MLLVLMATRSHVHGHRDLISGIKDVNDFLRRGRQQVSRADAGQFTFRSPRRRSTAHVGDAADQTAKRLRDALVARSGPRLNPEIGGMRHRPVPLPAWPRPPCAHPGGSAQVATLAGRGPGQFRLEHISHSGRQMVERVGSPARRHVLPDDGSDDAR